MSKRLYNSMRVMRCSPRTGELRLAAQRRRSGCLRTRHQQRRSWRSIRILDPTTHSRYGPSVCCLARRHAPPLRCSHTCHRPRRLRPAAAAGDSAPRRRARPPRRHATLRRPRLLHHEHSAPRLRLLDPPHAVGLVAVGCCSRLLLYYLLRCARSLSIFVLGFLQRLQLCRVWEASLAGDTPQSA